ncbi:MAG: hypothetical protein RLN76_11940 [Phycisphaeraceae bacterium]
MVSAIVALSVLLFVGYLFVSMILRSIDDLLDAEEALHAQILVVEVICQYIEEYEQVPQSWEDLLTEVQGPVTWSTYEWPRDVDVMQKLVKVDFNGVGKGLTRDNLTRLSEQIEMTTRIKHSHGLNHLVTFAVDSPDVAEGNPAIE